MSRVLPGKRLLLAPKKRQVRASTLAAVRAAQQNRETLDGGADRETRLSTFEYMSVMHSIVLALGMARVLGGIADVAPVWSQLQARWFFLGWLTLLLAQLIGWWFGLWARFGAMTQIGLVTFVGWFLIPASLYVASRLLIPEFPEGKPPDVEQRFAAIRVPFFVCLVISVLPVLPGLPREPSLEWLLAAYAVCAAIGVFVSDRRWHGVLLPALLGTFLTFMALARTSLAG